ncbi:GNAT family N-acetyltransferase [Poseidonocella sp. HB161398]|uniref:GNAT family N-acetyltransferase n=1 Tax=Poseidonocella sp. HB161398 TaxID=2320855 RepID=UPI0011098B4E|nr:GNAT family N-acetyltransferase [Poseidonocella sp. HB161398]
MQTPVLHSERLVLGPLGAAHFEPLAAFYASERSHHVGGPKTRDQAWRQLACEIGHWTLKGYGRFAVTEAATGAFVGNIGAWCPEGWPEPEIGWDLMAGFEGKGYATEAARAVRDWCYGTLGWPTAISFVHPGNPASAAVAKRLGCTLEGMHELVGHGAVEIWRHPARGSAEAAA